MKIYSVNDPEFKPYGRVVTGLEAVSYTHLLLAYRRYDGETELLVLCNLREREIAKPLPVGWTLSLIHI